MYYYSENNKVLCSFEKYSIKEIKISDIPNDTEIIYFLSKINQRNSRKKYIIEDVEDFYIEKEDIQIFCKKEEMNNNELISLINDYKIVGINTYYKDYKQTLDNVCLLDTKKRVNLLALGDVGSTLSIGLRLLGKDVLSET